MDGDRPLPAALRLAHPQQAAGEVDVVPVEPDQLAATEPAVGHHRQEQPVALRLAGEVALPQVATAGLDEQPLQLAHGEHVRQHLALLRRAQRQRRVALEPLLLHEEAEEALERRRRPRLARHRRPGALLVGEEGAQMRYPHLAQLADPLPRQMFQACGDVALIRRTGQRRQPPLQRAEAQKVGQFLRPIGHRSSFGQAEGRYSQERYGSPLTGASPFRV